MLRKECEHSEGSFFNCHVDILWPRLTTKELHPVKPHGISLIHQLTSQPVCQSNVLYRIADKKVRSVLALGGGRVRHTHSFTAMISIIAMVAIKIAKASGGGVLPPFV